MSNNEFYAIVLTNNDKHCVELLDKGMPCLSTDCKSVKTHFDFSPETYKDIALGTMATRVLEYENIILNPVINELPDKDTMAILETILPVRGDRPIRFFPQLADSSKLSESRVLEHFQDIISQYDIQNCTLKIQPNS